MLTCFPLYPACCLSSICSIRDWLLYCWITHIQDGKSPCELSIVFSYYRFHSALRVYSQYTPSILFFQCTRSALRVKLHLRCTPSILCNRDVFVLLGVQDNAKTFYLVWDIKNTVVKHFGLYSKCTSSIRTLRVYSRYSQVLWNVELKCCPRH